MNNRFTSRIELVLDYVRAHLDAQLDLETLAGVAGFSRYHFHRIFKDAMGETLSDYVARRRVERAVALMKADRRRALTDIALACGFPELSALSRAFKLQFGMPPSRWDRASSLQQSKLRQAPDGLPRYSETGLAALKSQEGFEVEIRPMPQQRMAYIRVVNAYENPMQLVEAFYELMRWVDARGPRGMLIGMSEDDPDVTPAAACRYDMGMTLPFETMPDARVAVRTLPACTIAALHCAGDIARVDRAWQYLYRHWLPNSGYEPDNLPAMEIYRKTPDEIGWETFDLDCAIAIMPLQ